MMAAQMLTSRGRFLGNKLVATRILSPCHFSTNPGLENNSNNSDGAPPPRKRHPQSFVSSDIHLELGELETELPPGYHQELHRRDRGPKKHRHANDGKGAYWRPPWKNPRAEIISAQDFANRPRVSFSESFASMHDAMLVLSWMGQDDKNGMYGLYLDLMTSVAAGQNKDKDVKKESWGVLSTKTSHEYVVRVVAQKYNVTTSRAAGVIQLQHNEEQLKKDPDFNVDHALQAHVDETIRENIRGVYKSYGEKDPLQFVEDPAASTGAIQREDTGSPSFVRASELTDVNALMKKTRMNEIDDAKFRIANHLYVEDVDERSRKVKVDQEATRLLKMGNNLGTFYEDMDKVDDEDDEVEEVEKQMLLDGGDKDEEEEKVTETPPMSANKSKKLRTKVPKNLKIPMGARPYPENNRGHNEVPETRRPRWKFAAQIINTHMLENPPGSARHGKKVAARAKGRRHGRTVDGNTLIEQGGQLRVASVAELEQTSWKHVRNESEVIFRGVKDAWLKRQLEGEVGGWGPQEEVFKKPDLVEIKKEDDEEGEGEEGDSVDEEKSDTDKKE